MAGNSRQPALVTRERYLTLFMPLSLSLLIRKQKLGQAKPFSGKFHTIRMSRRKTYC